MSSEAVFELFAYPGERAFGSPTTVTADTREIRWIHPKGSGRVGYGEITTIELNLGDPDPGDRKDCCVISTASGVALKVFCERGLISTKKDARKLHRASYSQFVRFLHQRLSPADGGRIVFKTDGKFSTKAQWLIAGASLASVALALGLFIIFGRMTLMFVGFFVFDILFGLAVVKMNPRQPRTYCPDPLDEKFLPS